MKDGKFVILCVDDDSDIQQTLRMILEKNGYLVATAGSAEEGFNQFKAVSPDLVIVDLMMEQVDSGTTLVAKLKAHGNKAPVYMLSTVGDELHSTVNAADFGLRGVFQKPIDARSLVATVKSVLK